MLFILFFTSVQLAHAQLLIGPKLGAQATIMHYDKFKDYSDSVTTTFTPGFSIGSVVNISINKPFSLQFELNYSLKGRSIKGVYDPHLVQKEKNHFIEVPALLRYSTGNKYKKIYFNAGPNLSYWLGGGGSLITSSLHQSNMKSMPYTITFNENKSGVGRIFIQDPNRLQIGLDFGLGMQLSTFSGQKVMVEFRYSDGHSFMGKSNSVRNNVEDYSDNLELSARVFNISCAYVFERSIHGWKKGKSVSK